MSKIDVLYIIDDDKIYHFTIKKTIQQIDIANNLLSFYNGEEAINFLDEAISNSQNMPDVILLDINMPVMDGWQFMESYVLLKPRIGKKIQIYMVSSSVYEEDIERAKSISDISDYIIKPITKNQLFQISEALAS
ncbi:transcriptional regulator [bacterium 336/3]|nr:transcriptional regulator [bacterium 336/3]